MIVSGQASADIRAVTVRYTAKNGGGELPGAVLPIRVALARRLGGAGPFAYFVAEIPRRADSCAGIALEAVDEAGESLRPVALTPSHVFDSPIPLAGSKECAAERDAEAFGSVLREMIETIVYELRLG